MGSATDSFLVQATQTDISQAFRYAAKEMRLLVKKDSNSAFVGAERQGLGFSWAAKIEASIKTGAGGQRISLKASNFGIGPVQSGHCKAVLETFRSIVSLKLSEKSGSDTQGIAREIEDLAAMREKGLLTDDEFAAAKSKLLS